MGNVDKNPLFADSAMGRGCADAVHPNRQDPLTLQRRPLKRKHASDLPVSAQAMYALTRLPDAVWDETLKSGDITPDTTEAAGGREC